MRMIISFVNHPQEAQPQVFDLVLARTAESLFCLEPPSSWGENEETDGVTQTRTGRRLYVAMSHPTLTCANSP